MIREREDKIHEIANVLFADISRGVLDKPDMGLFAGKMGVIIFCKHYLKTYPDPGKEQVLEAFVESYFEELVSGMGMFTYCSGLAGVLDGLRYLNAKELLEVDYSDIENNYKEILLRFALGNIAERNYDFLHGGLGVLKYFYNDPSLANPIMEALEESACKEGTIYKWKSQLGMEERYGYNISLSHGMSSIVSVLTLLTQPGMDLQRRDRLITGACEYILSQQIDREKYGCCFPSMSLDNDPGEEPVRSRLAWCYGDLGVASALWQAGRLLGNGHWMDMAREVFAFSTHRLTIEDSIIMDAGLCHGTASVGMMFHYIYRQTGDALFGQTRDYWLDWTLKAGTMEGSLAGYKAWHGPDNGWVLEYELLEGIAGIGLALLTLTSEKEQEDEWIGFFLLN